MRKILAVMLCAVMIVVLLSGCGDDSYEDVYEFLNPDAARDAGRSDESPDVSDTPAASDTGDSSDVPWHDRYGIDFDAVFATYTPDTAMMRIGDYVVTWGELFFYLRSNINRLLSSFGPVDDWSEVAYDDVTYIDIVLLYALDNAKMYKAIEHGAKINSVSLNAEDLESVNEEIEFLISYSDDEEDFLKLLWEEDGCYSLELLEYYVKTSYLMGRIITELYGDEGEKLSQEEIDAFAAGSGFMMAKHILRAKPEEGEEDTAIDEIIAIHSQLESYDGDDFDSFFDELMHEWSEDLGGLMSYPNGYLFEYGDMVMAFSETCYLLDVGEYSEIVESEFGYHIIYKLPIDFDEIPIAMASQGDYRTLRAYAGNNLFNSLLYEWIDNLEPIFTAEYEALDMGRLFN